jgi:hypothetical protein
MVRFGGMASIFTSSGTSTLEEGAAMTRIGSTLEFYITARDKSWWDPAHVPVVYVGVTPVTPVNIDYAAGIVELAAYTSGDVTIDCYWFAPEWLGGGYGFDVNAKTDKKDVTTFPSVLNTTTQYKSYLATLKDWTATVRRHYWYGRAWTLLDCTNDNSDLLWTWKSYGVKGNVEQVVYESGAELAVARANNKTTVTITAATTAKNIKDAIEADPTLAALWEVEYPGVQTGAGIVEAKTVQTCAGGKDHSLDLAKMGNNLLIRFYLNVTTGSLEMVSGVGWIDGAPEEVKLEEIIEADLTLQGVGRLKYHTV